MGVIKKNQMRGRIYSDGMMNKQTRVFNFQCFSLCYSITPFWNFQGPQNRHGIFWGSIFGPGSFLGFAGSPRDFFGSWLLAPFDRPRHSKSREPPLGFLLTKVFKGPLSSGISWFSLSCVHVKSWKKCRKV